MTIDDVRRRIVGIVSALDDEEVAHAREDALHRDVLAAIADGAPNAAELAREALRTTGLDFPRYCA